MLPSAIDSPSAAFVAGLVTSLHCAGMCGPLACAIMPVRGDSADAQTVSTTYHLTRLTSYAALGAIAGGLGALPLNFVSGNFLRWFPWLLVLFFVALAFRLDRYVPKVPALGRWSFRLTTKLRSRSRLEAAAALGFATPLLPCGPLYILIALALISGSALRGVEFMLAFGLGTVPLLWFAQTQFQWVRRKLSPLWLDRTRIALALCTALILGWRLRGTLGFAGGADANSFLCF
jgi:sulfite exporter TauE/SafE